MFNNTSSAQEVKIPFIKQLDLTSNKPKVEDYPYLGRIIRDMGRGVSSGGGQSSLDYLFGGGEAPKAAAAPSEVKAANKEPSPKPNVTKPVVEVSKQIPAGIHSSTTNNYFRADGQNTCNYITDRPSTKVHAAPGGGSSLDYLFGGGSK